MTAALKMAAPGELSYQLKKLMFFCAESARSIKAMRHHLAVTESVIQDLLNQALAQKLIWRQSNGMYKTVGTKLAFIQEEQAPEPANNSLLALEHEPAVTDDCAFSVNPQADDVEIIELDADLAALEQQGFVHTDGEHYSLDDALLSGFNLSKMADEFEREQNNNDYPVIDDLNAKERALSLCSLLLSPSSTELKRCIEALQMDLAVMRLHQERRG